MSTSEISTEDKLKKAEGKIYKLEDKLIQVFKQLNTIQRTIVLNVTMVDNLRLINIKLIKRIEVLEGKTNNVPINGEVKL